ncbi:hypothetical protein BDF19DRAFT_468502 [Syncephalis fuscata]|nr:hypothetical protein BDF19DRAFT_468502 [Syncephalis fuscata]
MYIRRLTGERIDLSQNDVFKKHGLRLTRVLSNTDSYYYAQANYKHDHVRIACHKKSDKPTIEFEVYKSFVNEDIKSGNKKAYGKEFLARPLLSFDFNDKHCFVTSSRCDQNIAEYTRNMDPLDKATELPAIFNQIIQGIDYLHSIGWAHNHIRPSSICINTSRITKTTKVLIRYFKRASLIQYDAQYKVVQVDKYPRPYLIDSPEWISGKSMDLRELDMWNIGTTFYGVTFVWKPRNDIPLLQDTALITLEDLTSSPWEPRLMSQAKHSLVMERQKPWRHLEVLAQALLSEDQYKSLKAKVVVKPTVIALMSTFDTLC